MIRIKYIYLLGLLFLVSFLGQAQSSLKVGQHYEPLYSQYWVNGLAINPAYAGSRECFSNTVLYRDQWMDFEGSPITQTLSSHAPFKDEKNAAGMFIFHEAIGVTDYYEIYGNYAFRFQLGEGRLSLGLRAGATFFQGSYADLKSNSEGLVIDDVLENESEIFPNVGVGAYYYTDKFFAGLSVPKLLSYEVKNSQKKMSIGPDNYDFLLTSGVLMNLVNNWKLKPSFLFRYRLDNTYQIDLGTNFIFREVIWLGYSYRFNDEHSIMLEYQATNQIRAGAAYGFALGDFAGQHDGTLEFILRYEFKYKIRAVSPRYF